MPTPEKEREVALLEDKFQRCRAMVFTDFRGLSAQEMVELRRLFRKNDLEYRVIKNTLARLAAQRVGLEVDRFLEGPTGVLIGYKDGVLPFKLALEVAKRFKEYGIKGGLIEGEVVEAAEAARIAQLPSQEELLAKLASVLQAPIQKLALDLKAIINRLAIALNEVRKKKSGGLPTDTGASTAETEAAAAETVETPAEETEPGVRSGQEPKTESNQEGKEEG